MNRNEKNTLAKKVLSDKAFRARFLADPKKAAASVGVELSVADVRKLKGARKTIRDNAAAYDKVRQFHRIGAPIRPYFLPMLPIVM